MYSIGMFSKINRITVKTLRHYDEIGLLKPCTVDDLTGYRYYSSEQLPLIHKIMSLKQMGFPLDEIKQVLQNEAVITELLKSREEAVMKNLAAEKSKLSQIQSYLKIVEGAKSMNYDVVIKQLPEVIVASSRKVIPNYEAYYVIYPEMGKVMEELGCVCAVPEYCFTIYHDGEFKETDIDVEICQAVEEFKKDTEIVKFKRIEEVPSAASLFHQGPYSTIGAAYGFLFQWIADNGYEIKDNPRESYIDGIWNKESEEEWLTEIQIPIKMQNI